MLLAKKHHDTHIDNIVGGAEDLVMETRTFNFVSAFRDQHPGISKQTLTQVLCVSCLLRSRGRVRLTALDGVFP